MRNRWVAGLGALCVAAGAGSVAVFGPGAGPARAAGELPRFDGCQQLRDWYVREAMPRVGPTGLDQGASMPSPSARVDGDALAPEESSGASSEGGTGSVGNGRTGTNLQELGVDEPDLAKTNGEIAVVVEDGELVVFDVSVSEPHELSRTTTRTRTADELLLIGDRVVVLGQDVPVQTSTSRPGTSGGVVGPGGGGARILPGPPQQPRTVVSTFDVGDPSEPELVDTRSVDGSYVTAREHDGTVRVVVRSEPDPGFVQPGQGRSPDEAEAKNRRVVRDSAPQDWLPAVRGADGGEEPLLSCSDVRRPRDPAGLAMTGVLTIDPDAPAGSEADAVVADGSLVYASANRLYVATMTGGHWAWSREGGPGRRTTQVHAFDTSGDRTSYLASGSVEGTVPDRWAMSEHDGQLRVASTRGDSWDHTETAVSVLEVNADHLDVVGSVGGLGEGEDVKAVRWFGDLGVVVTFRETDPLYTLDLADPRRPRVIGKLKIPGFSEYLHPVGGDLLVGVGQDASSSGQPTGSQVSSFDLSDLSEPHQVDRLGLGDLGRSAVEEDSRAFTYLPDQRLAFVPVTRPTADADAYVAVVRVGEDGALTPVRRLSAGGSVHDVRVLPLGGQRVAVVADGAVQQIAEPAHW